MDRRSCKLGPGRFLLCENAQLTTTKRWQARVDWPGVVANYAKGADWVMKQVECRILVGCGNRWGVVANYAQADFYFVRTRS